MYPRLYQQARDNIFYVEYARNKRVSLRTSDPNHATELFEEVKQGLSQQGTYGKESFSPQAKPGRGSPTLEEFIKTYTEGRQPDYSQKTIDADSLALTLLGEAVGRKIRLDRITEEKLQQFRDVCIQRHVKPVSINTYLRHIRAALNAARRDKHIELVPAIPFFREKGKTLPRHLRPDEIDKILALAQKTRPEFYRMLVFYLWTGARRQEALSLRWEKVYLDARNPYAIIRGKGDKERTVPLLPGVMKVLRPYKRDIGPVFKPINESTATHWFKAIARANGIKDARLHDLRHTAATFMLSKGIPLRMVQEILGHEDITTTAKIYGHVLDSALFKEMKKLNFRP